MSAFFIALAAPLALGLLAAATRPHARRVGDISIVEYGVGFKALGWILCVCAVAAAAGALLVDVEDRAYIFAIALAFALPAAYLLPMARLTRFEYDDRGITALRPWRKPVRVDWADVVNVQYSAGKRAYVVTAPGNVQLALHEMMSGVPDVLAKMQRKGVRGALLAQTTAG